MSDSTKPNSLNPFLSGSKNNPPSKPIFQFKQQQSQISDESPLFAQNSNVNKSANTAGISGPIPKQIPSKQQPKIPSPQSQSRNIFGQPLNKNTNIFSLGNNSNSKGSSLFSPSSGGMFSKLPPPVTQKSSTTSGNNISSGQKQSQQQPQQYKPLFPSNNPSTNIFATLISSGKEGDGLFNTANTANTNTITSQSTNTAAPTPTPSGPCLFSTEASFLTKPNPSTTNMFKTDGPSKSNIFCPNQNKPTATDNVNTKIGNTQNDQQQSQPQIQPNTTTTLVTTEIATNKSKTSSKEILKQEISDNKNKNKKLKQINNLFQYYSKVIQEQDNDSDVEVDDVNDADDNNDSNTFDDDNKINEKLNNQKHINNCKLLDKTKFLLLQKLLQAKTIDDKGKNDLSAKQTIPMSIQSLNNSTNNNEKQWLQERLREVLRAKKASEDLLKKEQRELAELVKKKEQFNLIKMKYSQSQQNKVSNKENYNIDNDKDNGKSSKGKEILSFLEHEILKMDSISNTLNDHNQIFSNNENENNSNNVDVDVNGKHKQKGKNQFSSKSIVKLLKLIKSLYSFDYIIEEEEEEEIKKKEEDDNNVKNFQKKQTNQNNKEINEININSNSNIHFGKLKTIPELFEQNVQKQNQLDQLIKQRQSKAIRNQKLLKQLCNVQSSISGRGRRGEKESEGEGEKEGEIEIEMEREIKKEGQIDTVLRNDDIDKSSINGNSKNRKSSSSDPSSNSNIHQNQNIKSNLSTRHKQLLQKQLSKVCLKKAHLQKRYKHLLVQQQKMLKTLAEKQSHLYNRNDITMNSSNNMETGVRGLISKIGLKNSSSAGASAISGFGCEDLNSKIYSSKLSANSEILPDDQDIYNFDTAFTGKSAITIKMRND